MRRILVSFAILALLAGGGVALAEGPLEATLEELRLRYENGSRAPKHFAIDEKEANVYLRERNTELPAGIEKPWIRFDKDLTIVGATLDLDKVKGDLPDSMLIQLLSGRVPVEVTARFAGDKGFGRLDLERVTLAGIDLPPSLVAALARDYDTSAVLPEGFRLGEPFPLPYAVESIRCRPGSVVVLQRATAVRD